MSSKTPLEKWIDKNCPKPPECIGHGFFLKIDKLSAGNYDIHEIQDPAKIKQIAVAKKGTTNDAKMMQALGDKWDSKLWFRVHGTTAMSGQIASGYKFKLDPKSDFPKAKQPLPYISGRDLMTLRQNLLKDWGVTEAGIEDAAAIVCKDKTSGTYELGMSGGPFTQIFIRAMLGKTVGPVPSERGISWYNRFGYIIKKKADTKKIKDAIATLNAESVPTDAGTYGTASGKKDVLAQLKAIYAFDPTTGTANCDAYKKIFNALAGCANGKIREAIDFLRRIDDLVERDFTMVNDGDMVPKALVKMPVKNQPLIDRQKKTKFRKKKATDRPKLTKSTDFLRRIDDLDERDFTMVNDGDMVPKALVKMPVKNQPLIDRQKKTKFRKKKATDRPKLTKSTDFLRRIDDLDERDFTMVNDGDMVPKALVKMPVKKSTIDRSTKKDEI
eukprot:118556_1